MDPLDDMFVPHLDSKLAPAVEATRREVDGTDNRSHPVGEEQLSMKFQAFKFVYLDAHIIQDAQAPNASISFSFFSLCGGRAMR